MQKKLIALAVAAAFSAPAFADATLYGAVDAAVASISGTNLKGDLLAVSGGAGASRFGINAAEDLDNGLKAVVNLEYGLDTQGTQTAGTTAAANASGTATNYSTIAARQQLLGLAGGFGTVATGYLQTTGYDWQVKFDPVAGSLVSPLQSMNKGMLIGTIAGAARAPRALAYISPNMGGVTVAVNYSTELNGGLGGVTAGSNTQYAKATAYLLSATYAGGPLTVGVVMASADTGKTNAGAQTATNADDMAVGASYDLGVAKLMGTYQTNKQKTVAGVSSTNKAMSFSAVIPAGPGLVGVQYATHKSAVTNGGGSGFLVGYLLPMSKTVTAYAAYESVKNQSAATAFTADNNALAPVMTAGGSSSVIALGLRKKF
jgi:predicted porin